MSLTCGLYVAATPIGNLRDITLRAIDTLHACDLILCEDTRVTVRLLREYGVETPMQPYHEHNAQRTRPDILRRLEAGEAICLVSDAGTPLISDPGYKLVSEALQAGVPVTPLPGASATTAALSVSGLPSDRFLFAGFPPNKKAARRAFFSEIADVPATLVFYESAPRLAKSLEDMADVFGNRQACVLRELTKQFEERRGGGLVDLAAHYGEAGPPKGEIVVVVDRAAKQQAAEADIDAAIISALQTLSVKDASAKVAGDTGAPKKQVYARALALKDDPV